MKTILAHMNVRWLAVSLGAATRELAREFMYDWVAIWAVLDDPSLVSFRQSCVHQDLRSTTMHGRETPAYKKN